MMGGMMSGTSMMWGMCMMMGIGLLLFVAIVGLTVYVVVRLLMKKIRLEDRPLMILRERYAKGEIEEEEYNQRRNKL
jgi:putative membrane protein